MSAEEMAAVAAAAQASLAQSAAQGQPQAPAGEAQPPTQDQQAPAQQDSQALVAADNTAGPWANEEDKPASVLRAEVKALIIRNEFLETVANEQAQKIFLLEEQLRNGQLELSQAAERVHIAEQLAVRAREAQGGGHQTGVVALAASIVPGGPSSARQLGRELAQTVGIQFPQPQPAAPAGAGSPPSWAKWPGDAQAAKISGGGGGGGGGSAKEICWFFQNGGCSKGAKCPFRHEDAGGGGGQQMMQPMQSRGATNVGQKSGTACWNFVHEGNCEYGDKCRFSHPGVPGGAVFCQPVVEKKTAVNCWNFVNLGSCEYGDGCRFVHPVDNIFLGVQPSHDDGRLKRSRFTYDGPA